MVWCALKQWWEILLLGRLEQKGKKLTEVDVAAIPQEIDFTVACLLGSSLDVKHPKMCRQGKIGWVVLSQAAET